MCVNLVSKMPHTCASFPLRWRKGLSQGFVHQFPFDLEAGLVCCVWANPGFGRNLAMCFLCFSGRNLRDGMIRNLGDRLRDSVLLWRRGFGSKDQRKRIKC